MALNEVQAGELIIHRKYGVGKVLHVIAGNRPEIEIAFAGRSPEHFLLNTISYGARKLSPEGFHALYYTDPQAARKMIMGDPGGVVVSALKDFPAGKARTDELKHELKSYIPDWEVWWKKAQRLFREDVRIDSSRSKEQEYAIARDVRSAAEEAYQGFRSSRRTADTPGELSRRALATLTLQKQGHALPEEHRAELLDYLMVVIHSNQFDLDLRLDTLFHLRSERWIPEHDAVEALDYLFQQDFRMHALSAYSQRRLLKILTEQSDLDERKTSLLISAVCGEAENFLVLRDWALFSGKSDLVKKLVVTAFSENLPPALPEAQYPAFRKRLEFCGGLLNKHIPGQIETWQEIFQAFHGLVDQLNKNFEKENPKAFYFPALINVSAELYSMAQEQGETSLILDSLVGPTRNLSFILAVFDWTQTDKQGKKLHTKLLEYFWASCEQRKDSYLAPFIDSLWKNGYDQAMQLAHLATLNTSTVLVEQAGKLLCEISQSESNAGIAQFLQPLNLLHTVPGQWPWSNTPEGLREKAYLEMLAQPVSTASDAIYRDAALIAATHVWHKRETEKFREQFTAMQQKLDQANQKIINMEKLFQEKDQVIHELRSGMGKDTSEARFEERSRLLKELVGTLAEFERFATNQFGSADLMAGILKRFSSLLSNYGVIQQDAIGTRIPFNPQKHRLMDGKVINPGEPVIVIERGYLIRDQQDKLRLLKAALVRKDG